MKKTKIVQNYRYIGLGFPIRIINAPMVKLYGKWALDVNMRKLQDVIAHALIFKSCRMTKDEIKFIRKFLGKSMEEFGKLFGVSHVAVLKWENGENRLPPPSEFYLRLTLLNHFKEKPHQFKVLYEKINLTMLEKETTKSPITIDANQELKSA